MSKKYAIFITTLFCAFIAVFLVAGAASPDKSFSELENRALQEMPKLEVGEFVTDQGTPHFTGNFFNGKFMTQFEKYCNDQFFGRDTWVGMKAVAELSVGKHENNGVYVCGNDTLISRFDYGEKPQKQTDSNIGYVNNFIENAGVPVYFSLIPGQATIWADKLPQGAPNADQKAIIDSIYGQIKGATTYDTYQGLYDHRGEDIYYRTDHHWTSLGAYYGYTSLMKALGMEPIALEKYTKNTVTESFYGTTFSSSGVRNIKPDSIWTYVPDTGIEVISNFEGTPVPGKLYNPEVLEKKDKYTFFMGGNQPLAIIKNENVDGPKIVILRDSYTDSLVPFLTQHFSEIHLYDLRYNRGSVPKYIADNDIDMALVLYSVPNFVTDTNLFTLKQK